MTNKNKLIAAFLVVGLLFSQQSKAVWPLLVMTGLVDSAGVISGAGVGSALVGLGLGGLIGERMGLIDLVNDDDGDGINEHYRFPLTRDSRDRPIANPDLPTQTTPNQTPTTQTPVSVTQFCARGVYMGGWIGPACAASLGDAWTAVCQGPHSGGQCTYAPYAGANLYNDGQSNTYTCPDNYTLNGSTCEITNPQPACGQGYTLTEGSCVLTQPEVIPDKNCDLKIGTSSSGSTYISNSSDPDCDGGGTLPDTDNRVAIKNGALMFDLMHPGYVEGKPPGYWDGRNDAPVTHVAVIPSGYGGECPYQVCIPIPGLPGHFRIAGYSTNASGQAQVATIDINEETGIVTQAAVTPLQGQILNEGQTYTNTAGQVVTVQQGQVVLANTAAGTYVQAPTNAVAQPSINVSIPTDYARSGEASTAADKIVEKLDETTETPDLLAPELVNPLVSYFNPLRAWSVPSQSGQCPTGSFSWNDHQYNFNVMCQLFNENLTLIQGAMNVFYTILALMIVLGA